MLPEPPEIESSRLAYWGRLVFFKPVSGAFYLVSKRSKCLNRRRFTHNNLHQLTTTKGIIIMLNHVMIGSNDIEKSKRFYDAVLAVLGAGEPLEKINATGQKRYFYIHNGSTFCLTQPINGEPATVANGSTIGFVCDSPEQIKELHDVAIANGGTTMEEAPGLRESNMGGIHLCYFADPDGHKMCGFHRV